MIVHEGRDLGYFSTLLREFIKKEKPHLEVILFSDSFIINFRVLIDMEVFGSKRHERKISYTDAKKVREILVGNYEREGLLRRLF
jgi:hypothetical protein